MVGDRGGEKKRGRAGAPQLPQISQGPQKTEKFCLIPDFSLSLQKSGGWVTGSQGDCGRQRTEGKDSLKQRIT